MGSTSSSPAVPQSAAKEQPSTAPTLSEQEKAVMQLKVSRDKLKKYRKKAENEKETLERTAREQLKLGRKDKALLALKTKRLKDQRLKKLEGQLDNVARLLDSIEEANYTKQVMTALEAGNLELKKLNEELPIERIEEIMQDSAEAMEHMEEVAATLSQSLTSEDATEVDAELAEMAAELNGIDQLPEAPTGKVSVPKTKESQPSSRVPERA